MRALKNFLKKILPLSWRLWFKQKISYVQFVFLLKQTPENHKKALAQARQKKSITVAFFLIHESVWKYEELYRLLDADARFNPIVVICPYIGHGSEVMMREMNLAYRSLKEKGYTVIKTLNEKTDTWLDVKKEIKPDIVFFTNPWGITKPEYFIQNYPKTLTCYVPYGFKNSYLHQAHYNKPMQNLVWKFFIETEIHQKLSLRYSRNKSINTVVTGYPGMDRFLNKNYNPKDVWKIKDKKIKRIIWAPHHTIPGYGATLDYSTFLIYCDFMLELARKYQNHFQFALKPHPILRPNLNRDEVWGKEKTDEYFRKWAELPNGQVHEGEYLDLFLTSDGMIHDSSSFIVEYLYTRKPEMFLIHDDSVAERFNEIGKEALSKLYKGKNKNDIEFFLNTVILQNQDSMADERNEFFDSIVKPPNNKTASENIFNHLKAEIFEKK
jgi:hypothetical protein